MSSLRNDFNDPKVKRTLKELHDNFVVVPADNALNNRVFVGKRRYTECPIKENGLVNSTGNPTYSLSTINTT